MRSIDKKRNIKYKTIGFTPLDVVTSSGTMTSPSNELAINFFESISGIPTHHNFCLESILRKDNYDMAGNVEYEIIGKNKCIVTFRKIPKGTIIKLKDTPSNEHFFKRQKVLEVDQESLQMHQILEISRQETIFENCETLVKNKEQHAFNMMETLSIGTDQFDNIYLIAKKDISENEIIAIGKDGSSNSNSLLVDNSHILPIIKTISEASLYNKLFYQFCGIPCDLDIGIGPLINCNPTKGLNNANFYKYKDDFGIWHICIFLNKKVHKNQEIQIDYGDPAWFKELQVITGNEQKESTSPERRPTRSLQNTDKSRQQERLEQKHIDDAMRQSVDEAVNNNIGIMLKDRLEHFNKIKQMIELKYSKEKGFHIIATKDIERCEVLGIFNGPRCSSAEFNKSDNIEVLRNYHFNINERIVIAPDPSILNNARTNADPITYLHKN